MMNVDIKEDMELKELYVDSFFVGQGIGSTMIDYLMNKNKDIDLWVIENHMQARTFYQKHGFVYIGERKLIEGTSQYDLRYRRSIDESSIL